MAFNAQEITPIQAISLNASRIKHGFFSRSGGVSKGLYEGLNVGLGSDDAAQAVLENRTRIAHWFGQAELFTAYQIHSPNVVVIDDSKKFLAAEKPKADALVTRLPNVVIGVLTADCGPVLFADENAGVIGAAHAGWGGAFKGVLENTIEAMIGEGAERANIKAVLGPSLSQENYEVGPEYVSRFLDDDADNARFFVASANDGYSMFDLRHYTIERLQKAGVRAEMLGLCTYPPENGYFSYRRSCHAQEPDYGRHISAIMLN